MHTFRARIQIRVALVIGMIFFSFIVINLYQILPLMAWVLLSLFLFLYFTYTVILLSYKVVIENNSIKEIYWGKIKKEVNIQNVKKIVKVEAGFFPKGMPLPVAKSYRYNLEGDFNYKLFPFLQVDFKFLDELIKLNPNIEVDSYFSGWISSKIQQAKNIQHSLSDKIAKVIGNILYGILFVMIGSLVLVIIGVLLVGLYRLITGQFSF